MDYDIAEKREGDAPVSDQKLSDDQKTELRRQGAEHLEGFLRVQRTNPYYFFVGALFAAILGRLAVWLSEFIPLIEKGFEKPPAHIHFETQYESVAYQCSLTLLVFFTVCYLWLYFSRVLVYVKETAVGEVTTFFVGFVSLGAICCLPGLWPNWAMILAAITFVVALKNQQVAISLRTEASHPVREVVTNGSKFALLYTSMLLAFGFIQRYFVLKDGFNVVAWLVLGVVMVAACFLSLLNSNKLFEEIKNKIRLHAGENPDKYKTHDALS